MTIANWITLLRLGLGLLGAFLINTNDARHRILAAAALFSLAVALDKVDGVVARRFQCCTDFGRILDTSVDKVILAVFFLCLQDLRLIPRDLVAAAIARDILTPAFRSCATSRGVDTKTYGLSYARYAIQCSSIVAGLLSVGIVGTLQSTSLKAICIGSFVIGIVFGYWTLCNLLVQHWRDVIDQKTEVGMDDGTHGTYGHKKQQ